MVVIVLGGSADKGGELVEWGMHKAQLCGIQFQTSEGRRFSVMASDPSVFKTRYDVAVGSGLCYGVLQEKNDAGKHFHFSTAKQLHPYQVPSLELVSCLIKK